MRSGTTGRPWVEVENRAERRPEARQDGIGLESLSHDARALCGELTLAFDGERVTVRVELPLHRPDVQLARPAELKAFAATVARRRVAYESAMFAGRAAVALLTLLVIALEPKEYQPHTRLYGATAIVIVVWSALLMIWRGNNRPLVPRRPMLLVLDSIAILALNVSQGGLSGPWYPVSLASIMPTAL